MSWNQIGCTGPAGTPGRNGTNGTNGATNVTTRSGVDTIPQTCTMITVSFYTCSGSASATVDCSFGERATGGGYANNGTTPANVTVGTSRPDPAVGTPSGWAVTASDTSTSVTPTPPPVALSIYVVCAAP